MPDSQPAQPLASTEAAQRARHQATVVTCTAAIVPTVLAMQGMASLSVDLLGFPVPVAIALAGFLELALISFALLTRASALAGRPGGVDAAAVWGVSLASGAFSALHELVGPSIGGARSWQVDPGSLLAAGVRLTAPLVAALLWERVLTAARREHEARSLIEVRRDRRLIAVAQAALTVRQLAEDRPRGHTVRLPHARRRLQRAHISALRMVGPGQDLFTVLAAVGAVDILPAATIPTGRADTRSDTGSAQIQDGVALSDKMSDTLGGLSGEVDTGLDTVDDDLSDPVHLSDVMTEGADIGGAYVPAGVALSETLSDTPGVVSGGVDTLVDTLNGDPASPVHVSAVPTGRADTRSDTGSAQIPDVVAVFDKVSDTPVVMSGGVAPGSDTVDGNLSRSVRLSDVLSEGADALVDTGGTQVPYVVAVSDKVSDTPVVMSGGVDTSCDTSGEVFDTSAGAVVVLDQLTIAIELVRDDRQVAGSKIAAAMRRHGHAVTDRTGLRWRGRAETYLAAELGRDVSDDGVRLAV